MTKPTVKYYDHYEDSVVLDIQETISFTAEYWEACAPSIKIHLSLKQLRDLEKEITKFKDKKSKPLKAERK